jgi:hypothetical protein
MVPAHAEATKSVVAQDAVGSLKLGGHLVDASLGAVVVLAR